MMPTIAEKSTESGIWPLIFKTRPGASLSDPDDFFLFCQDNADWRFEHTARGELIVKMPTGGETGGRNSLLNYLLVAWTLADKTGVAFDSNTGFRLPNGALRAPDAAWVRKERLATLTAEQKKKFLPLAPDFAVELRSESDALTDLQEKMEEYIEQGVRLGLLLDPAARTVYVYRPDVQLITLTDLVAVDCAPELPGLLLDVRAVFDTEL